MKFEQDITTRISERQMRRWNAVSAGVRPETAHPGYSSPRFITISRDEGTLGDEIAQILSQQLGWRVYDKEIVNYIAGQAQAREELVRQMDETSCWIHETILDKVLNLLKLPEESSFGSEDYHWSLLKTLATIAASGKAILMGRGANFVLRSSEQGIHVRITGTMEARIRRLGTTVDVPAEMARRRIMSVDAERKAFIYLYFKQDIDAPQFYDTIINTDHISIDQAVSMILSLLRAKGFPAEAGSSAHLQH